MRGSLTQKAWFHRAYPTALKVWLPLRRTLEGAVERHPRLEGPVGQARALARRSLGFDQQHSAELLVNTRQQLPEWLVWEWREIRQLDPDVWPAGAELDRVTTYRYEFDSAVIDAYERLCALTPAGTTHVFVVPWLLTGGADLEVLNYVRALHRSGQTGPIVVVATTEAASPWAARLPDQVTFIDLGRLARGLDREEQEYLLATYLVQVQPRVIHNINSDLAYRVLSRHARALRSVGARLFLSVFCFDYTPDGLYDGYQVRYLRGIAQHLDGIFCDNAKHLAELEELFALDASKLHVHQQPMPLPPFPRVHSGRSSARPLRVLWAGRLDRQKRPDLLIEVAQRAQSLPLQIDVYGDFVLDARGSMLDRLRAAPNVNYRGSFDGFGTLPVALYDVLLYTSQWDGMPNVLLEAAAHGLPIIASDVGGISEFVRDGQTGRIVSPYDNVGGYVSCLADACRFPDRLRQQRDAAQQLVAQRHSFHRFFDAIAAVPGYLEDVDV